MNCVCYEKFLRDLECCLYANLVSNFRVYLISFELVIQQFFFKPFAYDAVNSFIL